MELESEVWWGWNRKCYGVYLQLYRLSLQSMRLAPAHEDSHLIMALLGCRKFLHRVQTRDSFVHNWGFIGWHYEQEPCAVDNVAGHWPNGSKNGVTAAAIGGNGWASNLETPLTVITSTADVKTEARLITAKSPMNIYMFSAWLILKS